jgi:hypothetical protein
MLIRRRRIVRAVFVATLLLSLAAAASAQGGPCSSGRLAGDWGFTFAGTVIIPSGAAIPFASVGRISFDADGNVSGAQDRSLGGEVAKETFSGTFTVNSDCTGGISVAVYDQSETLIRSAEWAFVVDDDARELRAILISLVLPNGVSLRTFAVAGQAR